MTVDELPDGAQVVVEARNVGVVGSNPARRLGQHPEQIRSLKNCFQSITMMELFGLKLLPLSAAATARTPWFCLQHGLTAKDGALLAVMEDHDLYRLATADRQLQDVPPVKTYLVTDL